MNELGTSEVMSIDEEIPVLDREPLGTGRPSLLCQSKHTEVRSITEPSAGVIQGKLVYSRALLLPIQKAPSRLTSVISNVGALGVTMGTTERGWEKMTLAIFPLDASRMKRTRAAHLCRCRTNWPGKIGLSMVLELPSSSLLGSLEFSLFSKLSSSKSRGVDLRVWIFHRPSQIYFCLVIGKRRRRADSPLTPSSSSATIFDDPLQAPGTIHPYNLHGRIPWKKR